MTPKQILDLVSRRKIEFIDCRFMDFPGLWQHVTLPASELSPENITEGFGFDGSSVRGWQKINEADMLLVPAPETARIDPFLERPTLTFICDIKDPATRKHYSRDPRSVAKKSVDYLLKTGIADEALFAPEVEFFVFDHVRFDQTINRAEYVVDSAEGDWNRGRADPSNLGTQLRSHEGNFPCPPMDTLADLRAEMAATLSQMGFPVNMHLHESATAGQMEIDLRHQGLIQTADALMYVRHVAKNVAAKHGRVATFMPKPLYGDNGSGMHTHFSLWKQNKPLFAGNKYAGLSDLALYAVGGLLKHAPSLTAFSNPTTNSFKRLVPGYDAPVYLIYSSRVRSAAIRIPIYSANPRSRRLEYRCPDSACNPYLALAAMLMAAIDGIKNRIHPGNALDRDPADLSARELAQLPTAPAQLADALAALEKDHEYLLEGGVFNQELIRYWIEYKRHREIDPLRTRPHPYEFLMYFNM